MSNLPAVTNEHQTSNEILQLVSFCLDQEEYGVEVLKVREIIRMSNITRIPNTPPHVEGVINLRGKVIPIICMRRRFGLAETENGNQTRIMVMDVDGELMGFIVDSVSEVIRVSGSEIQPPPSVAIGNIEQDCIAGVINQADRLLVLLDQEKMFSLDERAMFATM